MKDHLNTPVTPFDITEGVSVSEVVDRMMGTSFQARNLAISVEVWAQMIADKGCSIYFGLAGAMVPSGMRKVVVYLIRNRLIDCVVSTGANLFHDLHETLGRFHYKGDHLADDEELLKCGIDRIYDTYIANKEFEDGEGYVARFAATLDVKRSYTTREFFYLLGRKLAADGYESGILSSAAEQGVPVYCPAIGDSAIGIGLARGRVQNGADVTFDVVGDVLELTDIALAAVSTGVVYVGGGTPKNFIQQVEVVPYIYDRSLDGHRYAIQITTDSPQWGGLSGCTFEEAVSWGKEAPAAKAATVHCDATIALPIIVSALSEKKVKREVMPKFSLSDQKLRVLS